MKFVYVFLFVAAPVIFGNHSVGSINYRGQRTSNFNTVGDLLSIIANINPEYEEGMFAEIDVNGLSCKAKPASRLKEKLAELTSLKRSNSGYKINGACVFYDIKFNPSGSECHHILTPRSVSVMEFLRSMALSGNTDKSLLAIVCENPDNLREPNALLKVVRSAEIDAIFAASPAGPSFMDKVIPQRLYTVSTSELDESVKYEKVLAECKHCRKPMAKDRLEMHENNCAKNPVNN